MPDTNDRCSRLRKLRARIEEELRQLREEEREDEEEGVANPVEIVNIQKSLQSVLQTITLELDKCPPEE
ncbi:MAG TPA: hypothetical protein VFQ36_06300 [Ktedonobacteraceae bacterium]|nr:hypothetical protein [Ktedonobacteraceae bacterium]